MSRVVLCGDLLTGAKYRAGYDISGFMSAHYHDSSIYKSFY